MRFAHRKGIQACIEGRVPAVSFFWVDPAEFIPAVHAAEIVVLHQVGSVDAAIRTKQAGVDVIIAQESRWAGDSLLALSLAATRIE